MGSGFKPKRGEYPGLRVEVFKNGFRMPNLQNILVINMGPKIASFRMSGEPKPAPVIENPKVTVNDAGNEIIEEKPDEATGL